MTAEGEAVVGGIDDVGIGCLRGAGQGVEDASDLGIKVGDQAVVFGELFADDFGRPGIGGQVFVTETAHPAVVEGMLRQEVFGQGRFAPIVGSDGFAQGIAGVMGSGEGDVAEERRILRVGVLKETDGGIGELLG